MSYKIPTGSNHEPFMRAWRALFDNHAARVETNFDKRFYNTYKVKMIRHKQFDGLDSLELEFENEAQYVLFMLEWS